MVESWGIGRPDFTKSTILLSQQVSWIYSNSFIVDPQDSEAIDIYTVPAGKELELSGGQISCKESVVNTLRLTAGAYELISDFKYDIIGDILVKGQTISAETTLTAYIYNNDVTSANISLLLLGFLTTTGA